METYLSCSPKLRAEAVDTIRERRAFSVASSELQGLSTFRNLRDLRFLLFVSFFFHRQVCGFVYETAKHCIIPHPLMPTPILSSYAHRFLLFLLRIGKKEKERKGRAASLGISYESKASMKAQIEFFFYWLSFVLWSVLRSNESQVFSSFAVIATVQCCFLPVYSPLLTLDSPVEPSHLVLAHFL